MVRFLTVISIVTVLSGLAFAVAALNWPGRDNDDMRVALAVTAAAALIMAALVSRPATEGQLALLVFAFCAFPASVIALLCYVIPFFSPAQGRQYSTTFAILIAGGLLSLAILSNRTKPQGDRSGNRTGPPEA